MLINSLGNILLYNIVDSTVWFTMIANNISSNQIPHILVPYLLVPLDWQENVKRLKVKDDRQQLRYYKHKGKHRIGCYLKSLLVSTFCKLKEWCTIYSNISTRWYKCNRNYTHELVTHTPKIFQIIHIYFTKFKEASRWFFNSFLLCLVIHPNLWWGCFKCALQDTQSLSKLAKGANNWLWKTKMQNQGEE